MDQSAVGMIIIVLLICLFFGVYCPSTEKIIRDDLKITLIMLDIFCTTLLPDFHLMNLQDSCY